ncbi:MAG: type I-E CRISPR-associated protein Cas7/Cse4/CasC [Chloroflexota bacterium]
MFLELHLIQSFAPSNLNRDDTGNPKDTEFGGVRRARISSQCIKRAIRLEPVFAQILGASPGTRTRWLTRILRDALVKAGKDDQVANTVALAFARVYLGDMDRNKPERSNVLIYLSEEEQREIADILLDNWKPITQELAKGNDTSETLSKLAEGSAKKLGEVTSAPDVALFGRMLARKPSTITLDAACQVAHAISTHRVNMDLDFFTAVDDLQEQEESETGAAMMGVTGFNSACFYRYARLDWRQLVQNLDGDMALARRTVEAFLRATLQAVPTGKQNAFAAQNPPSFALAVCRPDGMGWSLANAFEQPVRPDRDGGLVAPSIRALDAYWGKLHRTYGDGGITPVVLLVEDVELQSLRDALAPNVEAWVNCVLAVLPQE